MKIFDCFQYFDENMMLDLRLNILNKYVDHFVIVENLYMHNGKKKKQNFNINNFEKFKDKIEYILLDELPDDLHEINTDATEKEHSKIIDNALKIEKKQRNMIAHGLGKAHNEDLVFFSDVDEIPNLENFKYQNKITVFKQKMMYYKFNLIYPNFTWMGTKVCKKKDFKSAEWLRNIKSKKFSRWRLDTLFSEKKFNDIGFVDDGGWHFTNVKSVKDIDFKMRNFAHHLEYEESGIDIKSLKSNIEKKTVFYNHFADKSSNDKLGFEVKLKKTAISELPAYIGKNIEKYNEWLD